MATFEETTGKSIEQAFEDFHKKNPLIYKRFVKQCNLAIKKGKKKTSAKMIINVIR